MWFTPSGAAGRVRAVVAELKMRLSADDQEQRALERARELDAEDVVRRADRRQAERDESEPRSDNWRDETGHPLTRSTTILEQ